MPHIPTEFCLLVGGGGTPLSLPRTRYRVSHDNFHIASTLLKNNTFKYGENATSLLYAIPATRWYKQNEHSTNDCVTKMVFFFFSKHPVGSFVHCIVVMSCLLPPLFGPVVVFLVGKGRGGERKNEEEASDGLAWRFKEDFFSFPPSFSALVME